MPRSDEAQRSSLSSLSIIIPVRDAEDDLKRQLNSLQSWPEIEVVIVDDGSIDSTLDVASWYARQKQGWLVVSSQGLGPGAARNEGLRHSSRELVCFLDVDDELVERGIRAAVSQALTHSSDATLIAYEEVSSSTQKTRRTRRPARETSTREINPVRASRFTATCWAKLFRREFLDSIEGPFPDSKCGEDVVFNVRVFANSPITHAIRDVGYRHHTGLRGQLTADPNYLQCAAQSVRLLATQEFHTSKVSRKVASYAGLGSALFLLSKVKGARELGVPVRLWLELSRSYGLHLTAASMITLLFHHIRRRVESSA